MKLFLTTGESSQTYVFKKFPIIIGSNSPPNVSLSIAHLSPIHLKIIEKEGAYIALNETNDPFISLNGAPFHKKKISSGDILELNENTSIRFDLLNEDQNEIKPVQAPIKKSTFTEVGDLKDFDEQQLPPPQMRLFKGKISHSDPIGLGKNLRVTCTLIGMALIFFAFIASAFYTRAVEQVKAEEAIAAESIADIAMAFKHAQVHNLKPKKHNWSDPEFIKNNLAAVSTSDCSSISNIDTHGQFSHCPYLLRAYASHDFSHFIVIAQPNPSILKWLIPKSTIVVDSQLMELRKIQDVRILNRLLINGDILDGPNSLEITKIVEQGQLLPLATLAPHRHHQGFSPPKALALMHPGAENKIYNAPRYHHFGESIVSRALKLNAHADNPSELVRLRQEMERLDRFPDTVLYSSQGMETAMQTRRALAKILPNSHFLLGHLKHNSSGNLVSSNLIMDQRFSEIVAYDEPTSGNPDDNLLNIQLILENTVRELKQPKEKKSLNDRIGELAEARKLALEPITERLTTLLLNQLETLDLAHSQELKLTLTEYEQILEKQNHLIREELITLYQEHIPLPFERFLDLLRQSNLTSWIPESLSTPTTQFVPDNSSSVLDE